MNDEMDIESAPLLSGNMYCPDSREAGRGELPAYRVSERPSYRVPPAGPGARRKEEKNGKEDEENDERQLAREKLGVRNH